MILTLGEHSFEKKIYYNSNFIILYFLVIISSLFLICVNDFLSLFLVLELQALCLYGLAGLDRTSAISTEAGLKYFIWGSIFTGIFLFAVSLLYGCFGTLNFHDLSLLFSFPCVDDYVNVSFIAYISVFLIFCVFFFKLSVFPFHWWAPDVYEGSPLSSTFIFVFLPKIAFISLLIKFRFFVFGDFTSFEVFFIIVGCITVFIGAIFAFKQNRLKRFFIFSSISQTGFLISALVSCFFDASVVIYFFLIVYLISSVVLWGVYVFLASSYLSIRKFCEMGLTSLSLSILKNLFSLNFWLAFTIVLIFFSLSGVPPFCGFLAKLYILFELLKNFFFLSSLFLVLVSVVSVYYYINIVKISFFEPAKKINSLCTFIISNDTVDFIYSFIGLFSISILLFFFSPEYLLLFSQKLSFSLI